MNKLLKKVLVYGIAAVVCVASLTGCGSDINPDEIIATVGDDEISFGAANFFARLQQASYETFYAGMVGSTGEEIWNQPDPSGKDLQETVKEGLMDNLTTMYVLKQHAEDYDVVITEEEKSAIEKAAKDFVESNDEDILKEITADEETVKEILELMTIQNKMREPLMKEAKEAVDAAKEDGEDISESEVDEQVAMDYQYNEIIVNWKKDVKIDVDNELWSKVSFKEKGFTMKQQED